MKKRLFLMGGAVLLSVCGMASCQSENQESIDQYEITEIGKKENQIVKYESAPFMIEGFDTSKLVVENATFIGTPILFEGKNRFTKKQTELFADKYSYSVADLQDEASTCIGTNYHYYNKVDSSFTFTLSLAHPENYSGRCAFVSTGEFTDYLVKPKDTSKESFTIHAVTGPVSLDFIQL